MDEDQSDLLPEAQEREEERQAAEPTPQQPRVKRPPSAYLLFNMAEREKIIAESDARGRSHPTFAEISKEVGRRWKKLQARQRTMWDTRAAAIASTSTATSTATSSSGNESCSNSNNSDGGVRAGPAKGIVAKARHSWRSSSDTMRPPAGLSNRDLSHMGGGLALHRVDASGEGRGSRLSKIARRQVNATKAREPPKEPPKEPVKAVAECAEQHSSTEILGGKIVD